MGEIKVIIHNEKKEKHQIHMKDVSESLMASTLDQFFFSIGVPDEYLKRGEVVVDTTDLKSLFKVHEKETNMPLNPGKATFELGNKTIVELGDYTPKSYPEGRPKQLDKLGSERTLNVSLSEAFEKKVEADPAHWKTGYKVDPDGTKRYACYYWCPKTHCTGKGKHYIPKDTKSVRCRTCESSLKVETATDIPFPRRDGNGNFYRAARFMEVEGD